jgi:glutamine amidotransferase-like uncharacterized protein
MSHNEQCHMSLPLCRIIWLHLHVDAGEGAAAVVYRKIGEGHVVLTGPHPE